MAKSKEGAAPKKITLPNKKEEPKKVELTQAKLNAALEHAEVAHPHAKHIYINGLGQYHLHPRPGFAKVATNFEGVAQDQAEDEETETEDQAITDALPETKPNDKLEF